jgi:nucleotide-binding universal stress UspA family protein
MYDRIVVPLDGSDIAEQAIPTAEQLADALELPLHFVRIVEFPSTSFTYAYGSMIDADASLMNLDDEREIARHYLAEASSSSEKRGRTVTTEVREGIAVQELVESMQAGDLFVLASHGRSGMARWFLGSVAEEITRKSTVPVLLVRAKNVAAQHASKQDARHND